MIVSKRQRGDLLKDVQVNIPVDVGQIISDGAFVIAEEMNGARVLYSVQLSFVGDRERARG